MVQFPILWASECEVVNKAVDYYGLVYFSSFLLIDICYLLYIFNILNIIYIFLM